MEEAYSASKAPDNLDEMLVKYSILSAHFANRVEEIQSTGVIPNSDIEDAPQTVAEAVHAIMSMAFVCDRVTQDLLAIKFNLAYEESNDLSDTI